MTMLQDALPQLAARARKLHLLQRPEKSLYRIWAVIGFFAFASLELDPPMASKYWLLLIISGVAISIVITTTWLTRSDAQQQELLRPWILHWSTLLVTGALLSLNLAQSAVDPSWIAQQLVLLISIGWMTAGLYLRKTLLIAGLALAVCYLAGVLTGTPATGLSAVVIALSLWWLSLSD